ncbi:uncharacterized protein METZ01_LOCUS387510, partial [marine metagenome]
KSNYVATAITGLENQGLLEVFWEGFFFKNKIIKNTLKKFFICFIF